MSLSSFLSFSHMHLYAPAAAATVELLGSEGAIWTRLYTSRPFLGCLHVQEVTQRLGLDRIVVGHTIQEEGRITSK